MKKFRFQGNGDDTFGEYEQTSDDYDNCASGSAILYELKTPDGAGVIITGLYDHPDVPGDGWAIAVNVIDENKPVDHWTFVLRPSHEGYRNELTVIAPDDAELRCLGDTPGVPEFS